MNATLRMGTRIVVLALIFYSIGILTEQRRRIVSKTVLVFLTLGILFDITATCFMIVGSPNSPFTLHGLLGYSALAAMLTDTVLIWRYRLVHGTEEVDPKLHRYSRLAYGWWLVAFLTGSLLVFLK